MSKNNRGAVRTARQSAVLTERYPTARTELGAPGYRRDQQSELFLLAAGNLPGEKAFHENTDARVLRYRELVRLCAAQTPEWTAGLLAWMRGPGNLRLAPVEGAAEFAHARRELDDPVASDGSLVVTTRQVVRSVLQRADEPGEILAYWLRSHGRRMPIGFKRGVADGAARLYNERSLLRWDTAEAAIRFGDVIELTQPRYLAKSYGTWQDELFRYAIERRHGRGNSPGESLDVIRRWENLMDIPVMQRRWFLEREGASDSLKDAGMYWEALSGWLQGPMNAVAWQAIIPSMGYMALLRNLRNFDQAGVPDSTAEVVAAKLTDPEQVGRSRQFPFRFLSAYREAGLRWSYPLEKALALSLGNVPALKGRTLVLTDRSPSMWNYKFSERSDMDWADAAALFAAAIALRAESADLVEFWGDSRRVPFRQGESVLKLTEKFSYQPAPGGTDIPRAVREHYAGHDRVIIVTDEQTRSGWLPSNMEHHGGSHQTLIDDLIPHSVPLIMFNFGGYRHGAAPSGSGTRITLGGLTDASFRIIPLLESNRDGCWPWEVEDQRA
jgi:TROVE domain